MEQESKQEKTAIEDVEKEGAVKDSVKLPSNLSYLNEWQQEISNSVKNRLHSRSPFRWYLSGAIMKKTPRRRISAE